MRVDVPPSTVGVLPPLASAITEAEHFANLEAEEQAAAEAAAAAAAAAEAAAAAAEAAAMAEAAGEPVPLAEAAAEEPAAEEGDAGRSPEEAAGQQQAVEPEAAETEGAETEPTEGAGEGSGDGATLSELLQTAVNDQMGPVRAHMDVLIKSRQASLLAKMAELEAKITG